MVQVAALVALILSLLLLGLELLKAKIKHNLHYFIVIRPVMLSITGEYDTASFYVNITRTGPCNKQRFFRG